MPEAPSQTPYYSPAELEVIRRALKIAIAKAMQAEADMGHVTNPRIIAARRAGAKC